MPLPLSTNASTLLIRRDAFERAGITRAAIDERLMLTAEDFRVEGGVIAVGPILDAEALQTLVDDLEAAGLAYFDDFFELSGNWPDWVQLLALGAKE